MKMKTRLYQDAKVRQHHLKMSPEQYKHKAIVHPAIYHVYLLLFSILISVLMLTVCACKKDTAQYTSAQVLEMARNFSPECRLQKLNEQGEP